MIFCITQNSDSDDDDSDNEDIFPPVNFKAIAEQV